MSKIQFPSYVTGSRLIEGMPVHSVVPRHRAGPALEEPQLGDAGVKGRDGAYEGGPGDYFRPRRRRGG